MSAYSWVETKASAITDSVAVTNTVTPTSIIHSTAKPVLMAQELDKAGKVFRVTVKGRASTVVTTPGTLTLDIRFGSTIVWTSGLIVLNVTAQTNSTFTLDVVFTSRSVGSGTLATVIGIGSLVGRLIVGSPAASAGGAGEILLPDTAPVVGNGFDSTIAQTIDVFATWSIASASNSIQSHIAFIELVN